MPEVERFDEATLDALEERLLPRLREGLQRGWEERPVPLYDRFISSEIRRLEEAITAMVNASLRWSSVSNE